MMSNLSADFKKGLGVGLGVGVALLLLSIAAGVLRKA